MKKTTGWMIVATLLAVACSPYHYYATQSNKTDFTQYKTYSWLPGADSLSKSYYNNPIAEENIIDAANKLLETKGLTFNKDNPDLLFRYKAIVNNTSREIYAPYYGAGWGYGYGWGWNPWMWRRPWGWGGGGGGAVGRERFRAGHIILEAVDARTNKVVWQGRGSGEVDNPERAVNDLPDVVFNILKQYPLQARK